MKEIGSSDSNLVRPAWPSIKGARDVATRETTKSRPNVRLVCGTESIDKEGRTVDTVGKPPAKFWLYLSSIASHVTEEDISELVKVCLKTELTVDVRKLVSKMRT